MPADLDALQARLAAAAAVVESAADSIESEWGNAYDVYEAARFLGADVYVSDFDGVDVPTLVAELRAARKVVEACHAAERYDYDDAGIFRIHGALDRYDKVVG